jgi:acyl phosphate:glycerol-3-phosphate acyltransferase
MLAAFPTGLVLGLLLADVDIRAGGSGNIGATNANRLLGKRVGALTLAGDLMKGLVPVVLAAQFTDRPGYLGAVALAAFAGHCWSPYLDFKGGKGVATAAGAMLALAPWATILAAAGWVAVVRLTRRSSVGGLFAAALMPLLVLMLAPHYVWVAVLLSVGIGLRHRDNWQRLAAGTET